MQTALEAFAALERPSQPRHTSALETDWLKTLARKHAGDIEAMARDIKGNVLQKTPAQIRKACAKAGGVEKLLI
jgi:hypothetical protein